MNYRTITQQLGIVLVAWLLGLAGCREAGTPAPADGGKAGGKAGSTVDQVCKISAELLGVNRERLEPQTSLADLGADELDFVELLMELEDHFEITLSDEAAEGIAGAGDWRQRMKNVTMARLASLIDEQKRMPRSGSTSPAHAGERKGAPASGSRDSASGSPPREDSQAGKVKVFLNPLVALLAGAEKQKGRPLTREEVLEIRDNAKFVMMSPEQARKFYSGLDARAPVHRMNPDRVWEEWREIRGQLK